jgi:hypothetical protein
MAQMLYLRNIAARVEAEQPIIERRRKRQCIRATVARVIELRHRCENVTKRPLDG